MLWQNAKAPISFKWWMCSLMFNWMILVITVLALGFDEYGPNFFHRPKPHLLFHFSDCFCFQHSADFVKLIMPVWQNDQARLVRSANTGSHCWTGDANLLSFTRWIPTNDKSAKINQKTSSFLSCYFTHSGINIFIGKFLAKFGEIGSTIFSSHVFQFARTGHKTPPSFAHTQIVNFYFCVKQREDQSHGRWSENSGLFVYLSIEYSCMFERTFNWIHF